MAVAETTSWHRLHKDPVPARRGQELVGRVRAPHVW